MNLILYFISFHLAEFANREPFYWDFMNFQDDNFELEEVFIHNVDTSGRSHPLWVNTNHVTHKFTIKFQNAWSSPPELIFSIVQQTDFNYQGDPKIYRVSIARVSTTDFDIEIEKDKMQIFDTKILYLAHLNNPYIETGTFTVTPQNSAQSTSTFRNLIPFQFKRKVAYKKTYEKTPHVIPLWNGYQYDMDSNKNTFINIQISDITMTDFTITYKATAAKSDNIILYAAYLLYSGPEEFVEEGQDSKDIARDASSWGGRIVDFPGQVIATNNSSPSPSFIYTFAGFNKGKDCSNHYSQVRAAYTYTEGSSTINFQVTGNPNCGVQEMNQGAFYWMLLKGRKKCRDPRAKLAEDNITCVSCHESCEDCDGVTKLDCIKCHNNQTVLTNDSSSLKGPCGCKKPQIAMIPFICNYCFKKCYNCITQHEDSCLECYNNMTLEIIRYSN